MTAPDDSRATSIRALPSAPGSRRIVFVVDGRTGPADLPTLCDQLVGALKGSSANLVICDVGALVEPDVGTVDMLARLALTARRLGCQVRLRDACRELEDMVALVGLCSLEDPAGTLVLQLEGEPEEREHASGLQERGQPGDLTA